MYSKAKSRLEAIKAWAMAHKVAVVTAKQPHRPCTREMTPEEREELTKRPFCLDYVGVIGTP